MQQNNAAPPRHPIAFIDLQAQRRRLGSNLTKAIADAVEGGAWILGPQVQRLEQKLAAYAGVKHAVACANGTDALLLPLRAWEIGPGDAVFVPAFTFAASAEVVALVGATPVFVDVLPDTFNMDPKSLAAAIAMVRREGKLRPAVIMPVDLFGQPADYRRLEAIGERENLQVLCDSAQAFGATLDGKHTVAFGQAAGTSFYPAKPLGCYGDGGCCFTNDDELAATLRSLRVHGEGSDKYENVRIGVNSRLDTIQAAILIEKLTIFPDEIESRNRVAQRYAQGLARGNRIRIPAVVEGGVSTWAQYTLVLENRQKIQAGLKEQGIPTVVYYPLPLHRQRAYSSYPVAPGGLPVSDSLSKSVLSLPMHPYLSDGDVERIIEALLAGVDESR